MHLGLHVDAVFSFSFDLVCEDSFASADRFVRIRSRRVGFPSELRRIFHRCRPKSRADDDERVWGQGVWVGDNKNDGGKDLSVTYNGKNRLYHNENGVFTEVAEKAGVAGTGKAWSTGCAWVDYDRDGHLDLMIANYVDFDLSTAPAPGERPSCVWKGVPVMCGPRGLASAKNILYHSRGDGTFQDVTTKAHIDQTDGHYAFSVSTLDYNDDGSPDIYLALDT